MRWGWHSGMRRNWCAEVKFLTSSCMGWGRGDSESLGSESHSWELDWIVQGNQSAQSSLPPYLIENNLLTCHIKGCCSSSGEWPGVLWEPGRVLGPVNLLEPWVPFGTEGSPASSDPPIYILDRWPSSPRVNIHPSGSLPGCTSHTSLLHRAGLQSGLPGPCPSHEFSQGKVALRWCRHGSCSLFFSLIAHQDFPGGSDSKESACNTGDLSSIPGSGRSSGERNGYPLSILAWRIPWTEKPDGLQSMGSQRVRHTFTLHW